jgi:DNA-binding SARP family transcriptional activator
MSGAPTGAAATSGGGRWSLSPLVAGLAGAVVAVVVEEVRRIADSRELRQLRRALAQPGDEGGPERSAADGLPPHQPARPAEPCGDPASEPLPAGEVRLRLLGEVVVEGAPGPLDRPKVVESLAYLALHPDGVSKQRWATALWPDRALSPNSLNTAVWQLRRALGVDEHGERHLPAARSGRLRLGPGVRTDLVELEALAAEGSPASLQLALGMVRGRPFEGLGDPDWIVLEGHASRAEAAVAAAALALGEQAIDAGDWPRAGWAARRGLHACPYDERLYRLLAEAATAAGNPAAAAAAIDELRRALGPLAGDAAMRAG